MKEINLYILHINKVYVIAQIISLLQTNIKLNNQNTKAMRVQCIVASHTINYMTIVLFKLLYNTILHNTLDNKYIKTQFIYFHVHIVEALQQLQGSHLQLEPHLHPFPPSVAFSIDPSTIPLLQNIYSYKTINFTTDKSLG